MHAYHFFAARREKVIVGNTEFHVARASAELNDERWIPGLGQNLGVLLQRVDFDAFLPVHSLGRSAASGLRPGDESMCCGFAPPGIRSAGWTPPAGMKPPFMTLARAAAGMCGGGDAALTWSRLTNIASTRADAKAENFIGPR